MEAQSTGAEPQSTERGQGVMTNRRPDPALLIGGVAVAGAVLLAVITLIGRAVTPPSAVPTATTTAPYTRNMPVPTSSSAAPTTPANTPAAFGQTKTYTDGVAVSVAAPQPYTPSRFAAQEAQPGQSAFFTVTVTLTNGTATPFDPAATQVSAEAGGAEAEKLYDCPNACGGNPSTLVLPGKSVSWPIAFAAPSADGVIVQVTPGYRYQPALFTAG